MNSARLYAAGPLAGVATAALFYAMQGLVAGDGDVNLDPVEPRLWTDFVQDPTPPVTPKQKWDVEKPETVDPPAIEKPLPPTTQGPREGGGLGYPPPPVEPPVIEQPNFGQSDGEYLPLVVVQPTYPRRAQERGIEGYAVVELTVAADGSVPPESIIVIEAEPKGYFEREAMKAAAKFKYKPKIVNGVAQAVTGVLYQFSFNLKN